MQFLAYAGRRLAAAWRDLGPLRPIALASAVLPTVGALLLLARLDLVADAFAGLGPGLATVVCTGAIAVAVALLLLPPSFAAVATGFGLGASAAVPVAVVGLAGAAWLGRKWVWPQLAAPWFAFMAPRPRVVEVRRLCPGTGHAGAIQVAMVRGGARVPFAVGTLLFTAAGTPVGCVVAGSALAALPLATFAAAVGALWRSWRAGADPGAGPWLQLAAGAAAVTGFAVAARRRCARSAAA
ncbi:MAG: hypothetical protein JNK15_22280 [Planctomycetes bacterium]|nr:hypothetical protein [Planctomycetota bacterium]